MEQDRPKLPEDYGSAHARIRDLNSKGKPLADIMAKLAELDAPAEPAKDVMTTREETAADIFFSEQGIAFKVIGEVNAEDRVRLTISYDELKELIFMSVLHASRVIHEQIFMAKVMTNDGYKLTIFPGHFHGQLWYMESE